MTDDNPARSDARRPNRPQSGGGRRRRLLWILPVVLLALVGVVAALPATLSTDWGRATMLDWYNDTIPGEVRIERLSLSWLGDQSFEGLSIRDAGDQPIVTLDRLTTDLTLVEALRGRLSLGETVIEGLRADLTFRADGTSNLADALGAAAKEAPREPAAPIVPVTGNMALIDGRVTLSAPGIEPVTLDGLTGALEMPDRRSPVKLSFGGTTRQGDLAGSITVNGQVRNLFDGDQLTPASATADLDASVRDLPVDALDQMLGTGRMLSATLGDRTTVNAQVSGDAQRQRIDLNARAPNAELSLEGIVAEGRFSLASPATASLRLTPEAMAAINRVAVDDSVLQLTNPVPLHLSVARLDAPLKDFALPKVAVRAGVDAREPVRLTGIREVGELTIEDLRAVVDSPALGEATRVALDGKPSTRGSVGSLAVDADVRKLFAEDGALSPADAELRAEATLSGIPTALVDTVLARDGLLVDAIGPVVGMSLTADTGREGGIQLAAAMNASNLQAGPVQVSLDDAVTLVEPANLDFVLTPTLWSRLAGGTGRLEQPARAKLTLESFRMPLPGAGETAWRPGDTRVRATLKTTGAATLIDETGARTGLESLELDLGGESMAALTLNGKARLTQAGGMLERLDASPLDVRFDGRSGLTGDAALEAVSAQLEMDSPGLQAAVGATVSEGLGRLTLDEPASINATVTPALLAAAGGGAGPKATLRQAAPARIKLERLDVPLSPFSLGGLQARGAAGIDPLHVQTDGASTTIEQTRLNFDFDGDERGRLRADVRARVLGGNGEAGELSLNLNAGKLLAPDGALGTDDLSLDLSGKLERLPSALVDQLANMEGMLIATLGPAADIAIDAQLEAMRGPISLTLDASNAQGEVAARLGDEGLTLAEPLVARFEPTPEFGQLVLAKAHPIFETTQRAEQPIRFEVPAEGVRIPIEDFDFAGVTVPRMTMDFGKVILKSGWLLRGVVGLARQFGEMQSVQKEEWEAWFTPGVMEIRDGRIVYARRLDLLLDRRLHLATWGTADVSRDRSDLTLAFMPGTMERVFSITVAENDALHIPIKGPLSGPSVDFEKSAADLARLRAQEEVGKENPLAGALLGAVTGKATGTGGPVPPPSVSPLPWAELLRQQEAAEQAAQPSEPQQQQAAEPQQPEEKPSTEEQVIKGIIDLLGKDKKKE